MGPSEKTFILGALKETSASTASLELDDSPSGFAVHCSDSVLSKVMEHAVKCAHTEIFGLLLGDVLRTPSGKLRTVIRTFIPAQRLTTSTATFVEVSAEELIRMDKAYEEANHTDGMLKVGWFHTHPGHGIFMSATDRDNHAMYNKPWQVALVLDPIRKTSGFFAGPQCESVPVIGSHAVLHTPTGVREPASKATPSPKRRQWPAFGLFIGLLLVAAVAAFAYSKATEALTREREIDGKIRVLEERVADLRLVDEHAHAEVEKATKSSDERGYRDRPTSRHAAK